MERIRIAFAALKMSYFRTTVIQSRGLKSGHKDHHKEVYRESQLVHGWTDEWVKYLDYISKIDISLDAPYNQRNRYENLLFMRVVDSNKQAGPLCRRPDYKLSANALVSLQRAQGKGVPRISIMERTRQRDTLDPAV